MIHLNRRQMLRIDQGTEWLDTEPLGPSELRGHVVLVNWTVTRTNWCSWRRRGESARRWPRCHLVSIPWAPSQNARELGPPPVPINQAVLVGPEPSGFVLIRTLQRFALIHSTILGRSG